ncbi:MAG TPA: carbamoyltransferase HypF, partial [Dissulfurispiraceae bacterium]
RDFVISGSTGDGSFTLIPPDISICDDCLKELLDPSDRRYLYPFINCTNCGPRYSITRGVPYDRPNTTMSVFTMCPRCAEEYHDAADRRFHAQPNACSACGPQLTLKVRNPEFKVNGNDAPIKAAIELLKRGAILAVKGLGGFHLCCDAGSSAAVRELRARKRRSNKPFALMSPDIGSIRRFCEVSPDEEALLGSPRRPIVLLRKKAGLPLPSEIAPNNNHLGFMLPYTPLHYLLFHYPLAHDPSPAAHFEALVMTSGNLSEEPIVVDNDEAIAKLADIADAFLLHDRGIFMRVDDSVVKSSRSSLSSVRRARGFVPGTVRLKGGGPDVMGCGSDIKNTFTITRGDYAITSQHVGDMENLETLRFFEETLGNLTQVYRSEPVALAYDLHPSYLSTRWALSQKELRPGLVMFGIQHHYAHAASVMAEHGITEKVLGISFDGTGYGTDGNLWGGEFLVCDTKDFIRAAHFRYAPLPGGAKAVREGWRAALGYLFISAGRDGLRAYADAAGLAAKHGGEKIESLLKVIDKRQFSPLSSGAGRLFDAVASLAGVCDENTFEGEAAIALESVIPRGHAFSGAQAAYPFRVLEGDTLEVDFSPMFLFLLDEVRNGNGKGTIAARFHDTLVLVLDEIAGRIRRKFGIGKIVLSGGTFQNTYLLENALGMLTASGFEVYTNAQVPCNDAGISLGQAYIARERLK